MKTGIDATPAALVTRITRALQRTPPSAADLAAVRRQLMRYQAVPTAETVIESYYRCVVSDYLQRQFELALDALPDCVNSSHRAARLVCVAQRGHQHHTVTPPAWEAGWRRLRRHRGVDMYVRTADRARSLRRADLYVILTDGQVVSFEFKYVGPAGIRNPRACASQMGPYIKRHAATRLIIYSGTPQGGSVSGLARLRALLPADVPVLLHGPAPAPYEPRGS
jgi:hypothetical protein